MITTTAIYSGGCFGRLKGEPMWGCLKVKVTHGKVKRTNK